MFYDRKPRRPKDHIHRSFQGGHRACTTVDGLHLITDRGKLDKNSKEIWVMSHNSHLSRLAIGWKACNSGTKCHRHTVDC